MCLKEKKWGGCELDSSCSAYSPVTGSWKIGMKFGFHKGREFLDYLSHYRILKTRLKSLSYKMGCQNATELQMSLFFSFTG